MKIILSFLILSVSSIACHGGDGGFTVYTCSSDTRRTVLSIFSADSYDDIIVNFGIDGRFVKYSSADKSKVELKSKTKTTQAVKVYKNLGTEDNELLFQASIDLKKKSAVISEGFNDPRNKV